MKGGWSLHRLIFTTRHTTKLVSLKLPVFFFVRWSISEILAVVRTLLSEIGSI